MKITLWIKSDLANIKMMWLIIWFGLNWQTNLCNGTESFQMWHNIQDIHRDESNSWRRAPSILLLWMSIAVFVDFFVLVLKACLGKLLLLLYYNLNCNQLQSADKWQIWKLAWRAFQKLISNSLQSWMETRLVHPQRIHSECSFLFRSTKMYVSAICKQGHSVGVCSRVKVIETRRLQVFTWSFRSSFTSVGFHLTLTSLAPPVYLMCGSVLVDTSLAC